MLCQEKYPLLGMFVISTALRKPGFRDKAVMSFVVVVVVFVLA